MAVLAPLFFPTDPLRIVGAPELWPGEDPDFPLGTDSLGRDILAMIVHGARATLLIGLFASAVATLIGVSVGAIAGYFGGWVDELLHAAAELFQTIPNLIFVLTIVVILGSTLDQHRDRHRHRELDADRAHDPRRVPGPARPRVRAGLPRHGHGQPAASSWARSCPTRCRR